ncbi:sulfatase family protein [Nocardioides jishulii]|uniref:sulfatase family protein n=1 Tax=Nocardioides jishulii TaxID=2575440 RepID=UPI0014853489|nr:sulfatase [Nocardioides jishulii]
MTYAHLRETVEGKGSDGVRAYQQLENGVSLDGLLAVHVRADHEEVPVKPRSHPVLGITLATSALATCVAVVAPPASASAQDRGALVSGVSQAAQKASKRPNILMITADDATQADLAYMPKTRRLIANQGTTLTSGIAPTPICVPARATLMTGQYAASHGALSISGPYGGAASFMDRETLPVWLRRAGYDTVFVGKYLNGYGTHTTQRYVPPGWSNWQGSAAATYNYSTTVINDNGRLERRKRYQTDEFARRTNEKINAKSSNKKPWYMWVNYVAPHHGGPRDPDDPETWKDVLAKDVVKSPSPAKRHRNTFRLVNLPNKPNMMRVHPDKIFPRSATPRSATGRRAMRESYQQRLESLLAVDEAVASHIRALKKTRQLSRTIVMFSSDNGYFNGEHNLSGKLFWYEESLKVPMTLRGPGIPKGKKVSTPVTNADIPVTWAAIAHARPTRTVDGVDFRPYLKRGEVSRTIPLSGWPHHTGPTKPDPLYTGVRVDNQWTYVNFRGHEELFDLVSDPYQLSNLAKNPSYAARLNELRETNERINEAAQ